MKQALNRLALYCAAHGLAITVAPEAFYTRQLGTNDAARAISVDELADRLEATATSVDKAAAAQAQAAVRTLLNMGYEWNSASRFWWNPANSMEAAPSAPVAAEMPAPFRVPGYESLATVLLRAFEQAAKGKGKERHASAEPFTEQTTQQLMRLLDTTDGATHQAMKKLHEARRLPLERATAERLGAIIYVASIIIAEERKHADRKQAANDPVAKDAAHA